MMKKRNRVMVFGVFDLLHPGHISFLNQAKKLGMCLVVSVARDANVKKIKGQSPVFDEKKRMKILKDMKLADKVILGGLKDPWPHIVKEKPDVIALGYDQGIFITNHESRIMNQERKLEKELRKRGIKTKVVRLRSFRPEIYKSKILRKGLRN